jgi:predicted DsbA family dithiol-disulfide isomerase
MRLPPELRDRFGGMSEQLKQMTEKAGMEMVMPDVVPNSRRALEASEYAREQGKHEAFHRTVFRKLYGEGQDIGQWEVLGAAATEVGLDPEAMEQETEAGKYRVAVGRQIAEAQRLGITGVPTFIFNDTYALVGAQPYEVFQEAMDWLARQAEGSPNGGDLKG